MSAARRSGRAFLASADVSFKSSQSPRPNLKDAQHPFPTGPCNFRDLSAGHVCGCRRFWAASRRLADRDHAEDNDQDDGSCICGHHGCFHDLEYEHGDGLSRQHTSLQRPAIPSIETLEALEVDDARQSGHGRPLLGQYSPGDSREGVGGRVKPSPAAIDINTQTTGSARSELYLQQHVRKDSRSNRSSATEVASTPTRTAWLESRAVTKSSLEIVKTGLRNLDIGNTASPGPGRWSRVTTISTGEAGSKRNSAQPSYTEHLHEQLNSLKALVLSVPDVHHALSGIYQRLEAIENITSSQEVPEDLAERLDLLDHLEVRTLELETRLNSFDTPGTSHDDHSSIDASRKMSRGHSEEQSDMLLEKLNDIEHRLINIEGHTLPSSQSPWSIEVVVLPWGAELHGLWLPETTDSAWVQMIRNSSHHSVDRIIPRACGPSHGDAGLVYSRLLSCGLVRVVEFIDNSAYHIQSQLRSAYREILPSLSSSEDNPSFQTQLSEQFLGLQSALIPLRKVHRQSVLQCLSPAEMVTPVLWTASFLESSVFMKAPRAGIRRLYMTTPDGYIQPSSDQGSCTWATLRALSSAIGGTLQPNASMSSHRGDLECWNWNPRLDPSPADSLTLPNDALGPHDNISSSPFAFNPVTLQERGFETSLRHQQSPIPLADIKKEPVSDEDITYMPITPTSIFPSSQSHSKYGRKQSPAHQPANSRATISPIPPRSAPSSQKRALTSSFDSYASADSGPSRTLGEAGPPSPSRPLTRQRAKKRSRHIRQPSSPAHIESNPRQSSSSSTAQAHAALAYATPYSWNPAEDSPKGHGYGDSEPDSGDTDPVPSSPNEGSASDEADDPHDEDHNDDNDDSNGEEKNGNEEAPTSSMQFGMNGGSARHAARLLSPRNPNLLTTISMERGGIRHRYHHDNDQASASRADFEDEHDDNDNDEDDSMNEDDENEDEDEDDIMDDEDGALMGQEADNDSDDDDNSHEMPWR